MFLIIFDYEVPTVCEYNSFTCNNIYIHILILLIGIYMYVGQKIINVHTLRHR